MSRLWTSARSSHDSNADPYPLGPGSRVAVVGGGPAGCFFCYFLLEMASRIGLDLNVDVYEPKTYAQAGPAGRYKRGVWISRTAG